MPDNPLNFGGSVVQSATDQDSAAAGDYARQQQLLQQQQAQFQIEQSRALLEQTKQQQAQQQANRQIAGQTLASDAAQQVADPAYAGIPYAKAPQEVKQHFMDAYATVPGGGNGVAEQIPEAWNQAQRNATGNPNIGLEDLQEGQTAQVDMNGNKISVGKPPSTHTDPSTGRQYKIDPATGQATYIQIQDPAANASADLNTDPLSGLNPSEAATVKGLANYTIPLTSLNRLPPAQKERLIQHAYAVDPDFDASQYQIRSDLKKSFTNGQNADNIKSLNTVISHIGDLANSSKLLNNGQSPMVNTPGNWINDRVLGQPQQTTFNQDKAAVASEMAKLFKGTGSPTEAGIKEMENAFNLNNSPAQFQKGIEEALKLMAGRAGALRDQYENGFKKPNDKAWLDPKSRAVLRQLGVDPGSLDPASGNSQQVPTASQQTPVENPTTQPQSPFKTPEDVRDSFRAGTLPRDQAEAILKSQFGHK